jgi:hypothetical protein
MNAQSDFALPQPLFFAVPHGAGGHGAAAGAHGAGAHGAGAQLPQPEPREWCPIVMTGTPAICAGAGAGITRAGAIGSGLGIEFGDWAEATPATASTAAIAANI